MYIEVFYNPFQNNACKIIEKKRNNGRKVRN